MWLLFIIMRFLKFKELFAKIQINFLPNLYFRSRTDGWIRHYENGLEEKPFWFGMKIWIEIHGKNSRLTWLEFVLTDLPLSTGTTCWSGNNCDGLIPSVGKVKVM